ncbi:MAG: Gfo/Idh/MocA family protein [Planctomycetota bacterium]
MDRRRFLGDAAAAAAAFSVGMAASGAAEAPAEGEDKRPVKFGFIGTGAQGRFDMKQALRNEACECIAVADINPVNRQLGVKTAGGKARGYADYREMLDKEKDLEAVVIAVPLFAHAPIVLDALDAGKRVFSEKALAHTVEQCQAVCRKAKDKGSWVQVGHQRRYSPFYGHAMKLMRKDKALGAITTVQAHWHRNGPWRRAVPKDPPAIDFKKWGYESLEHLINWRLYTDYSGGLMAELGGHQLDIINWLLDMVPTRVTGIGGTDWYDDGREVFDNVQCVFEYPNGIKFIYSSICTNAYHGFGEEFLGRDGTLLIEGVGRHYNGYLFRERRAADLEWMKEAKKSKVGGKKAITLDTGATAQTGMKGKQKEGKAMGSKGKKKRSRFDNYRDEFAAFFDSCRTGKRPFCSEIEGMESAVTVIMANRAMRENTSLEIKPEIFQV